MVELLERTAEISGSVILSKDKDYSEGGVYVGKGVSRNTGYSTFAEMYLEKPIDVQAGSSVTVCTWRGIPTIDDW